MFLIYVTVLEKKVTKKAKTTIIYSNLCDVIKQNELELADIDFLI